MSRHESSVSRVVAVVAVLLLLAGAALVWWILQPVDRNRPRPVTSDDEPVRTDEGQPDDTDPPVHPRRNEPARANDAPDPEPANANDGDPTPDRPPVVMVLRGVVVDGLGAPVVGVTLEPHVVEPYDVDSQWDYDDAITDPTGAFEIPLRSPDPDPAALGVTLAIDADDIDAGERRFFDVERFVPASEFDERVTITLLEALTLTLHVEWPEGLNPDYHGDWRVTADPANGHADSSGWADCDHDGGISPAEDRFVVEPVMPGRHVVTLRHESLPPLVQDVEVAIGAANEFTLRPMRGEILRVRVFHRGGQREAIELADVTAERLVGASGATVLDGSNGLDPVDRLMWGDFTDENGEVELHGLVPGRYRVSAAREGGWIGPVSAPAVAEEIVDVRGGVTVVELTPPPLYVPDLRVFDADGEPVDTTYVKLTRYVGGDAVTYDVFISKGRTHSVLEHNGIPGGVYTATCTEENQRLAVPVPVRVPTDGPTELWLVAIPELRGRVTWADRTPITDEADGNDASLQIGSLTNAWTAAPDSAAFSEDFQLRGMFVVLDDTGSFAVTGTNRERSFFTNADLRDPLAAEVEVQVDYDGEHALFAEYRQREGLAPVNGRVDLVVGGTATLTVDVPEGSDLWLTLQERYDGGPALAFEVLAAGGKVLVLPRMIPGRYEARMTGGFVGEVDVRGSSTQIRLSGSSDESMEVDRLVGRLRAANGSGDDPPTAARVYLRGSEGQWHAASVKPDGTFVFVDVYWSTGAVVVAVNGDGRAIEPAWPVPQPTSSTVLMSCAGRVVNGVRIIDLDRSGPAARAGLRRLDVITHYGNEPVRGLQHYLRLRQQHAADNEWIRLLARRDATAEVETDVAPGPLAIRVR